MLGYRLPLFSEVRSHQLHPLVGPGVLRPGLALGAWRLAGGGVGYIEVGGVGETGGGGVTGVVGTGLFGGVIGTGSVPRCSKLASTRPSSVVGFRRSLTWGYSR